MNYGGTDKQYTDTPQWYDPLGPSSIDNSKPKKPKQVFDPSGAPQMRTDIFNREKANQPAIDEATGQTVAGLKAAAADPGWTDAQDLARGTIRGDYLHGSPELDSALATTRRAQMNAAADSNARNESQFAHNGMSFSTGDQQAADANTAAAAAAAGQTEAQARLANYEAERGRQEKGVDLLQNATSAPLNYLQNINSALTNPLATEASLISGLSTGGPVMAPSSTIVKQPGIGDYISGALSSY